MSMNKTCAISSWISFLISADILSRLAEFSESWIRAQGVPNRIEPEQRNSKRHAIDLPIFQFSEKEFILACCLRSLGYRGHHVEPGIGCLTYITKRSDSL